IAGADQLADLLSGRADPGRSRFRDAGALTEGRVPGQGARRDVPACGAQSFRIEVPAYSAVSPSISSIRISWLYFASRSDRASEPVLIWPQLVATARSAMVESSVSPERWLMTAV